MTGRVAHGKALPPEVVEQVVAKTDGVPLFVEELTKMVLESGLLQEREERYELTGPLPPLAIPATLHDSLMARLDRLATVKGLAQLGATLGREFSYELLQAVSPWDEGDLAAWAAPVGGGGVPVPAGAAAAGDVPLQARADPGRGLSVLAAEHPPAVPSAHCPGVGGALSRDSARPARAAGASLYRGRPAWRRPSPIGSGRASAPSSARPIWKRSAISPRGWSCSRPSRTPPSAPSRSSTLQTALGPALMATKGFAAPEVEQAYARARELCQQVGETPQLFPVLWGLWRFYLVRGELQTARELGEQLLSLAQRQHDPALLLEAHRALGETLFLLGSWPAPEPTWSRALPSTTRSSTAPLPSAMGRTPGWCAVPMQRMALWLLGYPDQALQRSQEALTLAQELSHPFSLAYAPGTVLPGSISYRREGQAAQERAEADMTLSTEQGFPFWLAMGTILRGWALAEQGQASGGHGADAPGHGRLCGPWGSELLVPQLSRPAGRGVWESGPGRRGAAPAGRGPGDGATTRGGDWEAELYRLKGELLLQAAHPGRAAGGSLFSAGPRHRPPPAGQVAGAAGRDEPEPPVAAAGQARRSARAAGADLRLVHRGL